VLWRKLQLNWRYAIGEFLIVVLGVLTALAVDNWNRDRLDRKLEQNYVAALIRDLGADLASLNATLERTDVHGKQIGLLLSAIETGPIGIEPIQLLRSATDLSRLVFPTVSPTTYNDLLSTGNLQVIEDDTIRALISRYYVDIEHNNQWQPVWRNYQEEMSRLVPRVIGHADRAYMDITAGREPYYPDWYEKSAESTMHDAEQVLSSIANDIEVFHAMENMHRVQALNYNRTVLQKEKVSDLISALADYSQEL
jgi:hypothetical protein